MIHDEKSYQTDEECFICLQGFEYSQKNMICRLRGCKEHNIKYYKDCIEEWLCRNSQCPFCRKPILNC